MPKTLQVKNGNIDDLPSVALGAARADILLGMNDARNMSSYVVRSPAHTVSPQAYHDIAEELLFVIRGSVTAHLGTRRIVLGPGDFLYVPPKTPHGFETREDEAVLLALLSPKVDQKTDFFLCEEEPSL